MTTIKLLLGTAFVLSSILGGIIVGRLVIEFPVRHKIGNVAYANYTRAAHLGNGVWLYPLLAIGSMALEIIAFLDGMFRHFSWSSLRPVAWAVLASAAVMATTEFAAPIIFRVGKTENKEELVRPLLERFVRMNYLCALFALVQWAVLFRALRR